jgi:hypothetical protein
MQTTPHRVVDLLGARPRNVVHKVVSVVSVIGQEHEMVSRGLGLVAVVRNRRRIPWEWAWAGIG